MILPVFITVISDHDKPQPPGCLLGQATVNITNTTSGRTTVSASVNTLTADAELIFKPVIRVDVSTKMLTQNVSSSYNPVYVSSTVSEQLIFSISPSLPAGLGLNSTNGKSSGTPLSLFPETRFTMTIRDNKSGAEDMATFELSVVPNFIVKQTTYSKTLKAGMNSSFEVLSINGGSGRYSYSVTPQLPTGMQLELLQDSTMILSGTPSVTQGNTKYSIDIIDDLVGRTINRELSISIN